MTLRRSVKWNLMASWADHVIGLLSAIALMPFVLHSLGEARYGAWVFIGSVIGYSGLLSLGFGQTISRYVADHHARGEWDKLNQVVNVILAVYVVMGLVAILAAGVLAYFAPLLTDWGDVPLLEVRIVLLILGLNVALGMIGSVFGGVLMGVQRFDIEMWISIPVVLLQLVLTFCFLQMEWGLLTLALIALAMTVVEKSIYAIYAFLQVRQLSLGWRHLQRDTFRGCFSFSAFAFVHNVAEQLINATDTIVIGIVLGARAIVPYYIAQRLAKFICKPIRHIGLVVMPRAGQLNALQDRQRLQGLVSRGLGLAFVLTGGFFIGAGFFGDALVQTWIGTGYDETHLLLVILLGASTVATPGSVLRSVLFGMGEVRVPALLHVAEAVANLALTLLLIRPLGVVGVAIGTLVPVVIVELGLLLPFALRHLQMSGRALFSDAIVPFTLPLVALTAYSLLVVNLLPHVTGWIPLVAISAGGGLVLGGVWLGLDRFGHYLNQSRSSVQV